MRRGLDVSAQRPLAPTGSSPTTTSPDREMDFHDRRRREAGWRPGQSLLLMSRLRQGPRQCATQLVETLGFELISHLIQSASVYACPQTHPPGADDEGSLVVTGIRCTRQARTN